MPPVSGRLGLLRAASAKRNGSYMTAFAELGLSEAALAAVERMGYDSPTPVQEQSIPYILEGRDVIAAASTGTGKTAAFLLPTLSTLERMKGRGRAPRVCVVSPTRELAQQISRTCMQISRKTGHFVTTVYGGTPYGPQIRELRGGTDVLIATPGRLNDLMDRGVVDLSETKVLVLDEADRMLDMGFWPSVRKIVARLPRTRQTLLFSATISGDIQQSMPTMLHDPVLVEISRSGQTADTVEQRLVPVVQGQKVSLLTHLIETGHPRRVLVFCRTKQRVDSVAAALEREGLKVGVMHADRAQKQRERALDGFRSGELEALVATDVMSRGIDVSDIDWVVNFDVPLDPEDYVHRIGRTGRAGESGVAFTFLAPDEVGPLREIEYFTKQLVPVWEPSDFTFAQGRIVPNEKRATSRSQRSVFSGSRSRGRGPAGGRFGRHS